MNLSQIEKTKALLAQAQSIVIIPHKNPDGDAMGSTLGLYHYLVKTGKKATVVSPNDYPDFLKWLPSEDTVLKYDLDPHGCTAAIEEADLIFTLDFNAFSRVDVIKSFLEAKDCPFIMIDHHQAPDDYAQVTYSDVTMSSTCEMVYHFIDALGDAHLVDENIANCLYTGIMTDTGSFRFPSTTATTHFVVSKLIEAGAKNADIHNHIYDSNTTSRLHLLGCALKNMVVLEEYNTVYITLSKKELEQYNFKKGDTEGFVNYGLSLSGIKFAVIFIENIQGEEFIKISLRSKGTFDVNTFSRNHYNGGGHLNAAGGRSELTLEETTTQFQTILKDYKTILQS